MDIKQHFYFLALRHTANVLEGVDFHGGITSATSDHLRKDMYLVDSSGQGQLTGQLCMIHQKGRGNVLKLCNQDLRAFPTLLTTDCELRWAFSGAVSVTTNDVSFDPETLARLEIPLLGYHWLGVLRRIRDKPHLDAYILAGKPLEQSIRAFCPDWTDGFHDEDGVIFTIERSVAFHKL